MPIPISKRGIGLKDNLRRKQRKIITPLFDVCTLSTYQKNQHMCCWEVHGGALEKFTNIPSSMSSPAPRADALIGLPKCSGLAALISLVLIGWPCQTLELWGLVASCLDIFRLTLKKSWAGALLCTGPICPRPLCLITIHRFEPWSCLAPSSTTDLPTPGQDAGSRVPSVKPPSTGRPKQDHQSTRPAVKSAAINVHKMLSHLRKSPWPEHSMNAGHNANSACPTGRISRSLSGTHSGFPCCW